MKPITSQAPQQPDPIPVLFKKPALSTADDSFQDLNISDDNNQYQVPACKPIPVWQQRESSYRMDMNAKQATPHHCMTLSTPHSSHLHSSAMSLSVSDTEYFCGEDGELYVHVSSVKPAKRPKKLQFDEEALELNVSMKSSNSDIYDGRC